MSISSIHAFSTENNLCWQYCIQAVLVFLITPKNYCFLTAGLVATSGGEGESEILLWNVRTGELASDLNAEIRQVLCYGNSMMWMSPLIGKFGWLNLKFILPPPQLIVAIWPNFNHLRKILKEVECKCFKLNLQGRNYFTNVWKVKLINSVQSNIFLLCVDNLR